MSCDTDCLRGHPQQGRVLPPPSHPHQGASRARPQVHAGRGRVPVSIWHPFSVQGAQRPALRHACGRREVRGWLRPGREQHLCVRREQQLEGPHLALW